jgi:hypothetical protein
MRFRQIVQCPLGEFWLSMSNALKGAALSGLVFPGLGQIMLKYYKRGMVLLTAVLASLAVMLVEAVERALAVLDKLVLEGATIDIQAISRAAVQVTRASGDFTFNLALAVLVLCWLLGTVDAYRIGRKIDGEELSRGKD